MVSRFTHSVAGLPRYCDRQVPAGDVHARYNLALGAHTARLPVTLDTRVSFGFSQCGFRPLWAKTESLTPIQIRAEKAAASRCFHSAFSHRRCLVRIGYAIGTVEPISFLIDAQGTGFLPDEQLQAVARGAFPLTPQGIIDALGLPRPI